MALAHVANDGSTAKTQAKPTTTIAFPSNVVSGNLLVLGIWKSANNSVSSISDTRGNTYQVDRAQLATDNTGVAIYSCISVGSGANTVSVTMGATTDLSMCVMEFSGVVSTSWRDAVESGSGSGTALDSGSGQSIAQANEVLIGFGGSISTNTPWTAGTSYTLSSATARANMIMEWQIVAATGTYDATMTSNVSNNWAMALATYKAVVVAQPGNFFLVL